MKKDPKNEEKTKTFSLLFLCSTNRIGPACIWIGIKHSLFCGFSPTFCERFAQHTQDTPCVEVAFFGCHTHTWPNVFSHIRFLFNISEAMSSLIHLFCSISTFTHLVLLCLWCVFHFGVCVFVCCLLFVLVPSVCCPSVRAGNVRPV